MLITCAFIFGLPMRATPNKEMGCIYVKKNKMMGGSPRKALHVPLFNGADFCGDGTVKPKFGPFSRIGRDD